VRLNFRPRRPLAKPVLLIVPSSPKRPISPKLHTFQNPRYIRFQESNGSNQLQRDTHLGLTCQEKVPHLKTQFLYQFLGNDQTAPLADKHFLFDPGINQWLSVETSTCCWWGSWPFWPPLGCLLFFFFRFCLVKGESDDGGLLELCESFLVCTSSFSIRCSWDFIL
jgi:hypothetical protein